MYITSRIAQLLDELMIIHLSYCLHLFCFFYTVMVAMWQTRWRWGRYTGWKNRWVALTCWRRVKVFDIPASLIFFIQHIFHWPVHLAYIWTVVTCLSYFVSLVPVHFSVYLARKGRKRERHQTCCMCGLYGSLLALKKNEGIHSIPSHSNYTSEMCNKEPAVYLRCCLLQQR